MKLSSSPYQRWLAAERDNDDAAADAAFARLLSQLPRVEANPDFAARTAPAAWNVRARRRLVTRLGRLTAVFLIGAASLAVAYESLALIMAGMVRGAVLLSRAVVWLLVAINEGVTWWSIAQRAATSIGQVLTTPASATALVVVEIVAACSLVAFHWLLRREHRDRQKGHV